MMLVGRYHEYTGGCSVHRGFQTKSMVLSTTFPTSIVVSPVVLVISAPMCYTDVMQGATSSQWKSGAFKEVQRQNLQGEMTY